MTLILFQVGQASCIPFCPNLVPCIHLPRQILSIDRHHFQWNTDTEVRYEIILVCKWKYRILRSFGNEIKLAGITTRWLRGPILEQRLVALMKRMLHFNKSTLVDYTMRKGLFCVNFIQRMLRLFLRFFTGLLIECIKYTIPIPSTPNQPEYTILNFKHTLQNSK